MATRKELLERAEKIAEYVIKYSATVRQAAKRFEISKSTVHKDLTVRLLEVDESIFDLDEKLYPKVRKVLDYNFSQRTIRGGEATRRKYKNNPKNSE